MTSTHTSIGLTLILAANTVSASAPATLDRTTVPAAGHHEALLDVTRYGRYAITAISDQGVAVQLVDRMAGPGEVAGVPGERDGRLDLILDRSRYKLVTRGHEHATGEAALAVHAFTELHADPAPELIELKLVQTELGDLEQRSYWLRVPDRRWVVLEAAGRHLRDLRLWRDGSWLVDAEPLVEVVEAVVGQPLLACRLAVQLEAGTYLLTAYGGDGQPWAAGSHERPLALRWGIPELGTAGRARFEVSPFGVDRYLVPRRADLYRLELAEARPARLGVTPYREASTFDPPRQSAAITKESREPVAEVDAGSGGDGLNLVTIEAEAGQAYVLQHFEHRRSYPLRGGTYWIDTLHTGHPTDSVDATGILVNNDHSRQVEPVAAQVVELDLDRGWRRTCNLLDTLTVFVRVDTAGLYNVELDGVEARYRFEPFLLRRPSDYREPRLRVSGSAWDLDQGYHVLTVVPAERGIVTMSVRHTDGEAPAATPVRSTVRFGLVELPQSTYGYTLFLNQRPGVKEGLVLRSSRLDLGDPLPLVLGPGEELELATERHPPGAIVAMAEDGVPLLVGAGDGWHQRLDDAQGRGRLMVRNPRDEVVWTSVIYRRRELLDTTPLPALPETALPALPDFPVLREGQPLFFDLARGASGTFAVQADEAGLYRLETTGLLDTAGVLRSRTVTELARGSGGGSGRNVLLHIYLRRGGYQVTVSARGESAGRAGIVLTRNQADDGGEVGHGVPARTELAAGDTVEYRFSITEAGPYRLRSLALGRAVRCRLEDADGWPIARPGLEADLSRHLEPGDYRMVLLSEPVEGRRVTLIEPVPEELVFTGRGPHPLPLATAVEHLWLEPEDGEVDPDRWSIELPAATRVNIRLTGEMEGELLAGDASVVATAPAGRGFDGRLAAGRYQLAVASSRHDNRVPYTVEIDPDALLAGMRRTIVAPAEVHVAVAGGGLTELASFGADDVRAVLVDAGGRLVAASDDRTGDWGFHIAERLEPGDYTLKVEPVGAGTARAEVSHHHRAETVQPVLTPPASLEVDAAGSVLLFPLDLAAAGELLVVSAGADGELGLAVDGRVHDGSWQTLAARAGGSCRLEVPLPEGEVRLRLWSNDGRGARATVQVAVARPRLVGEDELERGVRLEPVDGIEPTVAVAAVDLDRPGTLRVGAGLRASSLPGRALFEPAGGLVAASGERVWLAADGEGTARASRVVLEPGARPLHLRVSEPTLVDVDAGASGPLLVVAEAVVGQPLVALVSPGEEMPPPPYAWAASPGSAVGVALDPSRSAAAVWTAGDRALDVRLRVVTLADAAVDNASPGASHLSLEPSTSRTLRLPRGASRLRVTLDAGLVAALVDGDRLRSVLSAGSRRHVETVVSDARELVLLNPTGQPGRVALYVAAAIGDGSSLALGSPFEAVLPDAGTLRLRLETDESATLHLAGAARSATVLGDDGSFARGDEAEVAQMTGTILLEHDAGLVVAWLDLAARPMAGLWSGGPSPAEEHVELPLSRAVAGDRLELAFSLDELRLVTIRSSAPAVMRLEAGPASRVWLDPAGGVHHAVVAPGSVRLGLRGLAGAPLTGSVHVDTSAPEAVGEGLGPEVLLAPGAARIFRFSVDDAGRIGVGVRSDTDAAQCTLVSSNGTPLGHGVVQLHELDAGDYLLVVHLAAGADPTRARPAVVGLDRPGAGPPDDVIRHYLEEASR